MQRKSRSHSRAGYEDLLTSVWWQYLYELCKPTSCRRHTFRQKWTELANIILSQYSYTFWDITQAICKAIAPITVCFQSPSFVASTSSLSRSELHNTFDLTLFLHFSLSLSLSLSLYCKTKNVMQLILTNFANSAKLRKLVLPKTFQTYFDQQHVQLTKICIYETRKIVVFEN